MRPSDRPTTCPTRKIAPSPLSLSSRSQELCNSLGCLVPRKNHYTTSLHFALSPSFSRAAGGNHGLLCLVWKLEAVAVSFDFFEERFVRLIWNGELHKPSKQMSTLWNLDGQSSIIREPEPELNPSGSHHSQPVFICIFTVITVDNGLKVTGALNFLIMLISSKETSSSKVFSQYKLTNGQDSCLPSTEQ